MSRPKEIFLATTNAGKIKEIEEALSAFDIRIITDAYPDVEETEDTFEGNALLKACASAHKFNCPTLADDSGFSVWALDGAPGVFSSRWKEPIGTYDHAFQKIKEALDQKNSPDTSASFFCALAYYDPKTNFSKVFEGRVDGEVSFPPCGHNSFGYDPIFIPKGCTKTFAEMSPQDKKTHSHRGIALAKFIEWFVA